MTRNGGDPDGRPTRRRRRGGSIWSFAGGGGGIAGAMLPCPTPLHVEQRTCVVSAITPAQRLRDATALIFGNVIDDSVSLVQPCVDHCDAFASACGLVEQADVLRALMRAEVSVG